MGSVNRVQILGRLGKDPEVKFISEGQAVAKFSVATSEKWKTKAGEPKERTEWHRIEVWGKLAEICGNNLAKGREVYLEGKIQTDEYEKDGQKKTSTKIVCDKVVFVGKRPEGREPGSDDGEEAF